VKSKETPVHLQRARDAMATYVSHPPETQHQKVREMLRTNYPDYVDRGFTTTSALARFEEQLKQLSGAGSSLIH
jgi:hypothetical protein